MSRDIAYCISLDAVSNLSPFLASHGYYFIICGSLIVVEVHQADCLARLDNRQAGGGL